MAKFNFRLQSVLNYRGDLEEEAKREYQACSRARVEMEQSLFAMRIQRQTVLTQQIRSISERLSMEDHLGRLQNEESEVQSAINVLLDEEEAAKQRWFAARREAEVLRNLREKAHEAWTLDETRKEQNDLDEWAVLRR